MKTELVKIIVTGTIFKAGEVVTVVEKRRNMILVETPKNKGWIDKRECVSSFEIEDGVYFVKISGKVNKENLKELMADISDLLQDNISKNKIEKRVTNSCLIANIEKLLK